MARRRSSTDPDTNGARSTLQEPWSSSPTRPPRYVLKCYNHETGKLYLVNSYALYAARKIFDAVVGAKDWTRNGNAVTCHDIDITSDEMDAIVKHEYTPEEKAWDLPLPYPHDINQFLHDVRRPRKDDDEAPAPKPTKPAPVKTSKPESKRGEVTIQHICDELKMLPRDARAILRKAKVDKPAGGWAGDAKWGADIKAILQKGK
jgi:hypothetical protein